MKMNRVKVSFFLLAFLIGACTLALLNTRHITRKMTAMVEDVRGAVTDVTSITRMEQAWEKYEPLLDLYSRHDEVERISQSIEKLRPLYDAHEYTELRLALSETENALAHLMKTEMPSLSNIL